MPLFGIFGGGSLEISGVSDRLIYSKLLMPCLGQHVQEHLIRIFDFTRDSHTFALRELCTLLEQSPQDISGMQHSHWALF
jgi:hypothetical protein